MASLLDRIGRRRRPHDPARLRRRVLSLGLKSGAANPFPAVVGAPGVALPEPPMVLVTFHTAARQAVARLAEQLPGPMFVFTNANPTPVANMRKFLLAGEPSRRMLGLKQALDELRAGHFVLVAADGGHSSKVAVTLSGEPFELARGPFALARLAGAPVLPVAARWQGRRVQYTLGEPIAVAEEQHMADALAKWFEEYLARHPDAM